MGKFAKMLKMVDLLNSGNKYSIKELSEKTGVSDRMIRYYKEELEENGIFIESFKGPNGGYFMLDKIKNYTSINKYDIQLINYAYNVLKQNDFEFIDKFKNLKDKIESMNEIEEEKSKYIFKINIEKKDEKLALINRAIQKSESLKIIYKNIDGTFSKRIIHPLQLFQYENNEYVIAFCELRNDIRHFEIKRISIDK